MEGRRKDCNKIEILKQLLSQYCILYIYWICSILKCHGLWMLFTNFSPMYSAKFKTIKVGSTLYLYTEKIFLFPKVCRYKFCHQSGYKPPDTNTEDKWGTRLKTIFLSVFSPSGTSNLQHKNKTKTKIFSSSWDKPGI